MIKRKTNSCFIFLFLAASFALDAQTDSSQVSLFSLRRIEESVGLSAQYASIQSNNIDPRAFTMVSLPLFMDYTPTRYMRYTFKLNQGYQMYDTTGLYGLSNLDFTVHYKVRRQLTLSAGATLPVGTSEISADEFRVMATGKLPFIDAPTLYKQSGLGFRAGISVGDQISDNTSIAFGAAFYYRSAYTPILNGLEYDPSDVLMLSLGLESGDPDEPGFIGDLQVSVYTPEQMQQQKVNRATLGIAFSGIMNYERFKLSILALYREKSRLVYGGEFQAPSLQNIKLGYRVRPQIIPYAGYEHISKGSRVPESHFVLLGTVFEDFALNGYPLSPYLELRWGTLDPDATVIGIKLGTLFSFQIY
ncbi:MAG: hypothetical protein U5R06_19295 [candidate division KSB1 bacterium]|nr:hypothetical protein [candidate division KSB1 bacterium]